MAKGEEVGNALPHSGGMLAFDAVFKRVQPGKKRGVDRASRRRNRKAVLAEVKIARQVGKSGRAHGRTDPGGKIQTQAIDRNQQQVHG